MNEIENWKPVAGYEDFYEVSDLGRIRALFESWNGRYKAGRIIQPIQRPDGYLMVNLYYPGANQKGKTCTVHKIVLDAFVGPRPKSLVCRHLDGTRSNNATTNLKWGTREENVQDAKDHGTLACGERCALSKLSSRAVLEIRSRFDAGVLSRVIAEQFGISRPQASRIGNRKSWTHLAEA